MNRLTPGLIRAHAVQAEMVERRKQALCEEVEWWLASNAGWGPMLQSLGYPDPETLSRKLYRWGRRDLARRIEILAAPEKAKK